MTGIALSAMTAVTAQASTAQKAPSFPTHTINTGETRISENYVSPQQSALDIDSQTNTLVEPNLVYNNEAITEAKFTVTPTSQLLAERLNEPSQLSTDKHSDVNQIETDTVETVPGPSVKSQIPTVSTAELPPLATKQDATTLRQQPQSIQTPDPGTLAQASTEEQFPEAEEVIPDEVDPGRSTRSGASYIGVGANFGVGGDTSLGDSGLFVYSKVGLTRYFSARPAVTTDFNEDATFLLPLTFDLAPIAVGDTGVSIAPYFGGGPALSTNGDFGPVISGGIDMPLSERLTVTSGVNIGILDGTDVGIFLGLGYSFPSLF